MGTDSYSRSQINLLLIRVDSLEIRVNELENRLQAVYGIPPITKSTNHTETAVELGLSGIEGF